MFREVESFSDRHLINQTSRPLLAIGKSVRLRQFPISALEVQYNQITYLCDGGVFTVELGVLVPYPEEGKDANDHRRPSLQRTQM